MISAHTFSPVRLLSPPSSLIVMLHCFLSVPTSQVLFANDTVNVNLAANSEATSACANQNNPVSFLCPHLFRQWHHPYKFAIGVRDQADYPAATQFSPYLFPVKVDFVPHTKHSKDH